MIEIAEHDRLVALSGGDLLCRWVAQGLDGRSRAWRSRDGRGIAVAGPRLAGRDRLAVRGSASATVPLVGDVLAEIGTTYRPLGGPSLIRALVDGLPQLESANECGWMECASTDDLPPVAPCVTWLRDAACRAVDTLLAIGNPSSRAKPGVAGVERWAGIRDRTGELIAVAALAWSAPDVGMVSGVAVHPRARGRGLGRAVCAFVLRDAVERLGAVGLMVEDDNHIARSMYRGLGLRYRPLAAAAASPSTS